MMGREVALDAFPRQALHAFRLGLIHPPSGLEMEWFLPMAADLKAQADALRARESGAVP